MSRTATILSIFLLLVSYRSYAQYFQSTNYKEGSGLPSSETYSVFQDSRGFIWIASDNGVVRYDGHEFVTYNTSRGLTDNTVFGFHEDYKHRIWFRTYNGALSYYENDTIKSYKYNAELKSFTKSSILATITYDTMDRLQFSTTVPSETGRIDSSGNVTSLFGTSFDSDGTSIVTDEEGDMWHFLGYVGGKVLTAPVGKPREYEAIRIDGKEFPIEMDDPESQSHWLIGSVFWRDKHYFTIHKNIFSYDGRDVKKVFTSNGSIISIYVDRDDRLWVGSFNGGVNVFEEESLSTSFSLPVLSKLSVSSALQDYEGGIWISTLDQGVFYFPNLAILNYMLPNETRVNAMAFGKNEVFLGNYNGDVYRMNHQGEVRKMTKGVAPMIHLFVDTQDKLWISDGKGSHIFETGTEIMGRPKTHQSRSFKVFAQSKDFIVGANSMGLFKFSLDGQLIETVETRRRPTSMAITDNAIYIGELNGFEKRPINFEPHADFVRQSKKLGEGRTSSLHNLDNRFIAVGTISQGLLIYDSKKDKLTPLPVADVVNIYSMISDWSQRRMWIGTDRGLFQLDFSADTSQLVLDHFWKADGLVSNKINYVCRMGDNIWAISDLGISSVPLERFRERDVVPKFYINRILFEDRTLRTNGSTIRATEEDMVIDVRPITFKSYPTVFRYRINKDQPWTTVSGGSIFLVDLKPDVYKIEIQASSGNLDWQEGITQEIEVMGHWWETWTFRLSMVVLIVALAYVGYLARIRAIRRRQKYLELINLHQQKLIDSEIRTQERERKRIATDLHDGIGASLSSIKMQIANAIDNKGEDQASRADEITENLSDVIDDIKRIVYDLHPPGLERYGLQAGLKSLVDRLNKTSDLNVIFDYYGQRDVVQPVSITIFRILQELINNTLKHARASEIRIHINEFDDEINIMYEDNGIGMIGSRFTGLGLHSIESRVRSLNGRMSWESNHKGTFYNFDIPF